MLNVPEVAQAIPTTAALPHADRLTLRPYQEEALQAIVAAARRGVRRQLLASPTGSGKTLVASRVPEQGTDARMVYVAHREVLLQQTLDVFERDRPDRPASIERGEAVATPNARTVVASIQSLTKPDRLARYAPASWPLLVIDEAHRSVARAYRGVLAHFGFLDSPVTPGRLLLGMTGTTQRTDHVGLDSVYDEVVYTATLAQMIEAGYLVPLRGLARRTGIDLSAVGSTTTDGECDYNLAALSKTVNTPARNQLIVDVTRHTALAEGRPTLAFACDIAHTEALAAQFRQAGIRAAAIHGGTTPNEQDAILTAFRAGKLQVVVNCLLWTEGVDIPQIAAVVMGRPTKSAVLFQQSIGRGSRLSPGKQDCLVLDFVDATRRHADALVTLPTLVGLPADFDLGGEIAHDVARRFDNAAAMLGSGLDIDTAARVRSAADIPKLFYEFDLVKIAGMPPALSRLSQFVWQRLSTGTLAITIPKARPQDLHEPGGELILAPHPATLDSGGQFEIIPNVLGHYEVRFAPGLATEQKLGEYKGLDDALRAADQEIRTRFPDRLKLLDKNEPWRARPMTARQVATLKRFRKLGVLRDLGIRPRDLPTTMSCGQATLWISRITLQRARTEAARARRSTVPPNEPATPQQRWKLRSLGARAPDGLTKDEARRRIGRLLASQGGS